jgi:hypothetical protein
MRDREELDLIIHSIFANGIHRHHAVGQICGRVSRLFQNAYIADGGAYILHLQRFLMTVLLALRFDVDGIPSKLQRGGAPSTH